ncbi:hypothetical protein B0H19DRAFT_1254051 [Mycena capillaripes]|nr:hypothetical protein B0H19DRAFT_1254051 [Mycena capillaripes]
MNVCEPAISLVIPWHQLTQYRAFGDAHKHLSVFQLSIAADAPVQVRLPHLVQLKVGDSEFLRLISAPILRNIIVQRMDGDDDALLPLLPLTLNALRIHIHRGDTAATDELIARLTIRADDAACFAPNLTTLEFIGRGAFNQERFVDMVRS